MDVPNLKQKTQITDVRTLIHQSMPKLDELLTKYCRVLNLDKTALTRDEIINIVSTSDYAVPLHVIDYYINNYAHYRNPLTTSPWI